MNAASISRRLRSTSTPRDPVNEGSGSRSPLFVLRPRSVRLPPRAPARAVERTWTACVRTAAGPRRPPAGRGSAARTHPPARRWQTVRSSTCASPARRHGQATKQQPRKLAATYAGLGDLRHHALVEFAPRRTAGDALLQLAHGGLHVALPDLVQVDLLRALDDDLVRHLAQQPADALAAVIVRR
jgi:hypothetical protein